MYVSYVYTTIYSCICSYTYYYICIHNYICVYMYVSIHVYIYILCVILFILTKYPLPQRKVSGFVDWLLVTGWKPLSVVSVILRFLTTCRAWALTHQNGYWGMFWRPLSMPGVDSSVLRSWGVGVWEVPRAAVDQLVWKDFIYLTVGVAVLMLLVQYQSGCW